MHELRDLAGRVVVPHRPGLSRERHVRRREGDLAPLVLDVELDRVQPLLLERDVLLELAGKGRERSGHVDAPYLDRQGPRAGRDRDRIAHRLDRHASVRGRPGLVALSRERHPAREAEDSGQQNGRDRSPAPTLPPACRVPASAEALVRVHRWIQHGHRIRECR